MSDPIIGMIEYWLSGVLFVLFPAAGLTVIAHTAVNDPQLLVTFTLLVALTGAMIAVPIALGYLVERWVL